MAPNLLFYQLLVIALVVICLLSHVWWPHPPRAMPQMPHKPDKPRRKRSTAPTPFPGLIHQPLCAVCEQGADTGPKAPGAPPPILTCTRGRRRTVDTHAHFCPAPQCAYRGWLDRGNIRAHGHPGGQPWRQLQCVSCQGYFYETYGHCQLNGKSLTDAFPSRESDGVPMAKIQRFVTEQNQPEFFLYCTNV